MDLANIKGWPKLKEVDYPWNKRNFLTKRCKYSRSIELYKPVGKNSFFGFVSITFSINGPVWSVDRLDLKAVRRFDITKYFMREFYVVNNITKAIPSALGLPLRPDKILLMSS